MTENNITGMLKYTGRDLTALRVRSIVMGECCVSCGEYDTRGEGLMCPSCRAVFLEKLGEKCPTCGLPAHVCTCVPAGMREAGCHSLVKLGFYDAGNPSSPVNRTVIRLKDRPDRLLARRLAILQADTLSRVTAPLKPSADGFCVLWVPRSRKKIRETGVDQAQLMAKALAAEMKLPAWDLIRRTRSTSAQQKTMGIAGRAANVSSLFRLRDARLIFGRTVIIVDDLVTTGSTLSECVRLCRDAGAAEIVCVCIARTAYRAC